jgi:endonuclease G
MDGFALFQRFLLLLLFLSWRPAEAQTDPNASFPPLPVQIAHPAQNGDLSSPYDDEGSDPGLCRDVLVGGFVPEIRGYFAQGTQAQSCNDEYLSLVSSLTRSPLWVAQRLTKVGIQLAGRSAKHLFFHDDDDVPPGERASLSDYGSLGYVCGQMAAQADMTTDRAQYQSGSLANVAPMYSSAKDTIWPRIDAAIRSLGLQFGEIFVVTGPVYSGPLRSLDNSSLAIPTYFFRAIYVPAAHAGGVYVMANDGSGTWGHVSLANFAARTGLVPFPGLSNGLLTTFALPDPLRGSTAAK